MVKNSPRHGIPQGSPLSVVLYTIYAKALSNTKGIDYIGIYADNIFVVASGKQTVYKLNSICRL